MQPGDPRWTIKFAATPQTATDRITYRVGSGPPRTVNLNPGHSPLTWNSPPVNSHRTSRPIRPAGSRPPRSRPQNHSRSTSAKEPSPTSTASLSAGAGASLRVDWERLGAGCGGLSGVAPSRGRVRAFDRHRSVGRMHGSSWRVEGDVEEVRVSRPSFAIQPQRTGSQRRPVRAERSEPRSGALDGPGAEATSDVRGCRPIRLSALLPVLPLRSISRSRSVSPTALVRASSAGRSR